MTTPGIDAVSVAIIQNGQIVLARGYGAGIDPTTRFQAASISKPVSTFATLKLVEAGKMTLEAPLSSYVHMPYLPIQPWVDLVTAKTVMNHTSGLPNDPDGVDRQLRFKPGTQFLYSGGGFAYLQRAVEDVTGRAFDAYADPILHDLGMSTSTYALDYQGTRYVGAAYSLVTTPSELARFFDELASPRPENQTIATLMKTPTVTSDDGITYGLGVGTFACGDDDIALRHSGQNFSAHRSLAVVFEKSRIGAVVMARGEGTSGVPGELVKLAIGGEFGE
jgi:CubicO group peptidase (beta-lactamase class C family)